MTDRQVWIRYGGGCCLCQVDAVATSYCSQATILIMMMFHVGDNSVMSTY